MIHGTLQWAAQAMNGKILPGDPNGGFTGVSTDTRELNPGELFFCLVANRDGHEFAGQAIQKGAAAAVVDEKHAGRGMVPKGSPWDHAPTIIVKDTLRALGDLAQAWRKNFSIPLIAIGGSNGKTTTKELASAVLATRYRVLATEGNLNNLLGVPKTLFRLEKGHQAAVIEAGMNEFGELARLTEIMAPTAALLTNIGMEHLEKLGDLKGVARAEGELFAGLDSEATALVNLTDPEIALMKTPGKKIFYGTPETEIWGEVLASEGTFPLRLQVRVAGKTENLSLKIPGAHNLFNVLAALAVGNHLGISLKDAKSALENFLPPHSRMELIPLKKGIQLIDDCYNANPSSASAALKTLAGLQGKSKSLAILGEMLELGERTDQAHRQIGRRTAEEKIDYLIAVGPHAFEIFQGAMEGGMRPESLQAYANADEAMKRLSVPDPVRWILVKGSRGIHLEKIVNYLKERL